jgi:predicted peroxiredoxin
METTTSNKTDKLVILLTRGIDDERATAAWTVANGGLNEGLEVTMFLVSNGVDVVRRGGADLVQINPVDPPMKQLIETFKANGGQIWACPPCAKLRGYTQDHLIDGVVVTGTPALHGLIKEGAATLCF